MKIRCLAPNFHERNSSVSVPGLCDHDSIGGAAEERPGSQASVFFDPERLATARNDEEPGRQPLAARVGIGIGIGIGIENEGENTVDPDPDGGSVV
jgi:hypothetical protein